MAPAAHEQTPGRPKFAQPPRGWTTYVVGLGALSGDGPVQEFLQADGVGDLDLSLAHEQQAVGLEL